MITSTKITIVLVTSLLVFNSCTLFFRTLKVEVPKKFTGWCYIIPTINPGKNASPVLNARYQVDVNGIVSIPSTDFDVKKDYVVKVYEAGTDVSDDIRYAGSALSVYSNDSARYNYIQFYLPSIKERSIPGAAQYWRDKMYEYRQQGDRLFDSLLKSNKLAF